MSKIAQSAATKTAIKYKIPAYLRDDAVQEYLYGVMQAADEYNQIIGANKLSYLMRKRGEARMINFLKKERKFKSICERELNEND